MQACMYQPSCKHVIYTSLVTWAAMRFMADKESALSMPVKVHGIALPHFLTVSLIWLVALRFLCHVVCTVPFVAYACLLHLPLFYLTCIIIKM